MDCIMQVEYNSRRTRGAGLYQRQCRKWVPAVRLTSDEVTKSGRTGITIAYTEDMLSRERTMDCIMHYSLGDNTIY